MARLIRYLCGSIRSNSVLCGEPVQAFLELSRGAGVSDAPDEVLLTGSSDHHGTGGFGQIQGGVTTQEGEIIRR